jgi:single-strand DNA-binding protein
MNLCLLTGNLGADPELRSSASGLAIAKMRLAIGERRKQNGEWVDHTEWVALTAFGATAENAAKFLSKGSQIQVRGKISTSKYTDQNGNDKYFTEVIVDDLLFLGGGQQRQQQQQGQQQHQQQQPQNNPFPQQQGQQQQNNQGGQGRQPHEQQQPNQQGGPTEYQGNGNFPF